jgi:hypothetical protein
LTVRSCEDALKLLLALSNEIGKLKKTRKDYLNSGLNAADKQEKLDKLDAQLEQVSKERIHVLNDLVMFPPRHLQYQQFFEQFNQMLKGKPYERRVFVMTKYGDGANAQLDAKLKAVVDTVKAPVVASGYHPSL